MSDAGDGRSAVGAPRRIGPYTVRGVLGEGGMGMVYRAVQTDPMKREVALKVIRPGRDSREIVARLESERQALAVMDHSSIARVLDAGTTEDGRPYFAMELVRGVPIDEYCDVHKLTMEERIQLFARVCDAVQHAHQKGVIHRDLKPSNVLVAVENEHPLPKVIDFGIAKAVGSGFAEGPFVTHTGQLLGTPAYMSPEQAEMSGLDVDTRTDVYSLGVMLYELLSGTSPFDRETLRKPDFVLQYLLREKDVATPSVRLASLSDTQQTVARNRSTDVRALRRALEGDLDWIVMKAMEKDRTRRYSAASELAADLRRYLSGEAVLARPPSAAYRARKFVRRHAGALAASVAVLLSITAGAVVSTLGYVEARRGEARADAEAGRAEAVTSFLDEMLRAADPVEGQGPETSVRDLLDAASERVADGGLAGRPLVEAAVRRSIGGTYMQLGLYDDAEAHLEAARALLGNDAGGDVVHRVRVLQDLGQLRRRQGRLEAAESFQRSALALADSGGLGSDGGAGERLVNDVRNDLALALQSMDRTDESAAILEEIVASERGLSSRDDLAFAASLNNLALVRRAQGDAAGAMELFQETLDVLRRSVGDEHVYVAAVLESIGSLEQLQGRYEDADQAMRRSLEMRRSILGESHPDIVNGLNGLGLLRLDMGDLDGASEYLSEALSMSEGLLGPRHDLTGSVLNNLGLVYLRQGDAEGAESALRRSFDIREAALGARHSATLNTESNLAAAILEGGRAGEAERMARAVVETEREIGLRSPVTYGVALRNWGMSLTALGRLEEAQELLLESFSLQESELSGSHQQTRRTALALAELYDAWGRTEEASDWRNRAGGPAGSS